MPQRMRLACRVGFMAIAFTAISIFGCNNSDLSQYHQVDKRQSQKAETEVSSAPIAAKSTEQTDPSVNAEAASATQPAAVVDREVEQAVSALVPLNVVDGANVRRVMNAAATEVSTHPEKAQSEAPAADVSAKAESNTETRKIELLVKEKAFRADPKTGALRVSFDDLDLLKVLNMDPIVGNAVELMPDWLRGLNGKAVRLRGYMFPTFDAEGIEHFVLARDNQICCFGRDPKVYDLVQVNMKAGKSTNYIHWTRAFDVVGIFKIELVSEDGKWFGLYSIDNADVIDR